MTTEFRPGQGLKVFFKDGIIDRQDATLPILSPAAQFGLSVFEGIRYYLSVDGGQLNGFRVKDHFQRLVRSARLLDLGMGFDWDFFREAVEETIKTNRFTRDVVVRAILVPEGEGSWTYRGQCNLFVSAAERGRVLSDGSKGLSCQTSSWRRIAGSSMPPSIKMGANYINSRLAQLEAIGSGVDSAIFLNDRGSIAEAPGSCVAIVVRGGLVVAPAISSVLDSITIDTITQIAVTLNLPVVRREFDRMELICADEAMLVGTTMEIVPISSVDRKTFQPAPGPITSALSREYLDAVRGVKYLDQNWLSSRLTVG